MNTTKLIGKLFASRQRVLTEDYVCRPEAMQRDVLRHLVSRAASTEWGRQHRYDSIQSYDDYARLVPVQTYDEVKAYVDRMRHGEADVLWPGRVRWYAKSSGTTNDKSKFIPVSRDILHDTHYAGGRDCVASYLMNNPHSRFFSGKGLILGGSHAPNYNVRGSLVGDLSAILIENINPLVNFIRVPEKKIALLADFEQKRDLIARSTLHAHVTNLSGVPSWMLSVLHRVMELSGKTSLDEVPQFLNVLAGDLSVIGPRPVTEDETYEFGDARDEFLSCKPGITGWWQVTERNDATWENGERQLLELFYVRHASIPLDLRIFFRTFKAMGRGK